MRSLALLTIPLIPIVLSAPTPGATCKTPSILNTTYLSPTFSQPRSTISSYTLESFHYLLEKLTFPTGWVGQNGWTTVAQWDLQSGSRLFYDQVKKAQDEYATNPGGSYGYYKVEGCDDYNDDCGWAALANLKAYQAYGDEVFLDRAKGIFQFISTHGYIHQSDIAAGHLVGTKYPNVTLQGTCNNGQSMVGGVYWRNGVPSLPNDAAASDAGVNAVSTGLFALLGAQLCGLTSNTTYCDLAYSSMQWIDRMLRSPEGIVYDNILGSTCKITPWTFTYNAGLYMAAYTSLSNTTSNTTALALAEKCAIASMTTNIWNNAQGVITEGAGDPSEGDDGVGFKAILIRYLHQSYPILSAKVQVAIRQYINIQYWSLVNKDSNDPKHPVQYGRNWVGPFVEALGQTQVTAMDVLNGVEINPDSAFPSGNASTTGSVISTGAAK